MVSTFKHIFFWLSGAGSGTLEQCPEWEQRKYVAFGATVLVPCAFAFIACSYALSTLTDDPWVIYSVATVWSFIIMTIDRALLAGYRPFLSWRRKLSQFALRLGVAILMGLTIAHPLVLLLFKDTISSTVEKDRAVEIQVVRDDFDASKEAIRAKIIGVEGKVAKSQQEFNDTYQAEFIIRQKEEAEATVPGLTSEQQEQLTTSIAEATAPFTVRLDSLNEQAAELTPVYTKNQTELEFWQAEYERELNGQRSGIRGEGPRARSITSDQLNPRRAESKRLGALLEHLTTEKATLQKQIREAEQAAIAQFETELAEVELANKEEDQRVATLKQRIEADQAAAFVGQQNSIRETIKTRIDTQLAELKTVQTELVAVGQEERARINEINDEPRRDILTQTLALHSLFKAGTEGGQFALITYIVLTALFMLVDTIPLIVKFFSKPGPYDTLLDRDEISYDSEHRAFEQSHKRYMEQLASGNLIAVTRNKNLENALVEGVEHSRAAQEFLDSLIEMERSFSEKMRLEQEATSSATPEKLAAFEAMKKSFYDDLHARMQSFFAARQA